MKIKNEFVVHELAGEYIVVPVGSEADRIHGIIKLNSTGYFLWCLLLNNIENVSFLENALASNYSIDTGKAKNDVAKFLNTIDKYGCLEK